MLGRRTARFIWGRSSSTIPARSPFAKINDDDVSFFRKVVGESGVVQDVDQLNHLNQDWMKHYKGTSTLALFPKEASTVSKIVSYCNEKKFV